jgi:hypothetical protein
MLSHGSFTCRLIGEHTDRAAVPDAKKARLEAGPFSVTGFELAADDAVDHPTATDNNWNSDQDWKQQRHDNLLEPYTDLPTNGGENGSKLNF